MQSKKSCQSPTAQEAEISALKLRVLQLEKEVEFLRYHPTLAQGLKGERFICQITEGIATSLNARFDVKSKGGLKLEVKFSKLHSPEKSALDTKRWSWSKPMGWLDKGKDYDFLLLVGDKDYRFEDQYVDDSPYVVFLIPSARVHQTIVSGKTIGANINLTTNFSSVRSVPSLRVIDHMVGFSLVAELLEKAVPRSVPDSSR
ncbi:hypothetical protein [Variovorax sp. CF079]|uniref:hypothetical protein n=1 Tax=Variovorax sp. CF079 TaxID=1882774 RepID=UPI001113CE20|nr:hypothetical protein [Variovorax sp. CF079]